MKNSNLKKKALAFGASVAILMSGCGGSGGGSGGGSTPTDPENPTESTIILGDDMTDVGEGILTPNAVTTTTYNGTTCKNVIFNAASLPANTKLIYDNETNTLTRIRIVGTANDLNMEVDNGIVGADAVTGESNIDVSNVIAKGDFYTITATSAGAGVVAEANGGNVNLNYDYSVENAVTPPTERIVLANAFNTAAANDIEPVQIYLEGDSRNAYEGYTFKETYIYETSQFPEGGKFIFPGQYDEYGTVNKRIMLRDTSSVVGLTNVDLVIENAQFKGTSFDGTNSIYIDVPHNPISPRYPFDPTTGVHLLDTGRLSDNTTVSVPKGSKLYYSGTPTIIKY